MAPSTTQIAEMIPKTLLRQLEHQVGEQNLDWMVTKIRGTQQFALVYIDTDPNGDRRVVPVKIINFASSMQEARDKSIPGLYTQQDMVNFHALSHNTSVSVNPNDVLKGCLSRDFTIQSVFSTIVPRANQGNGVSTYTNGRMAISSATPGTQATPIQPDQLDGGVPGTTDQIRASSTTVSKGT